MGELGIKSTFHPKRYKSYKGDVGNIAPNRLGRNFVATKPNEKWVTDVTELNIKGEKVYLSPILDLYNQEIISYEIADQPRMKMVMEMLKKYFSRLNHDEQPTLHSDQGELMLF